MIYASIFIFFLGLALLLLATRRRKAIGLPAGRIISSDTRRWSPVDKSLFDKDFGLTGKPDYIIQQGDQYIPVEVKSSRVTDAPYDGHILQLVAYCRLVDVNYGKRPKYGILHYPNRTYAIDYTHEMEAALSQLLDEIRTQDRRKEIDRSHEAPGRCQACGYHSVCEQKLV